MDAELKQRWIEALEGPYADRKGRNGLCIGGLYCCLGVLAEIEGILDDNTKLAFPQDDEGCEPTFLASGSFGLLHIEQEKLAEINDKSDTFAPVIEYIRENL